ncbi:MAG: hypothetical protein QM784_19725 [Polyangiaceae bacterium]
MSDVVLGLLAIIVGALFCFQGYLALRLIIPIWGALAGFSVGAGFVAEITGDGFLSTGVSWIVGIAVALLFAVVAYLYYAVSVVVAYGRHRVHARHEPDVRARSALALVRRARRHRRRRAAGDARHRRRPADGAARRAERACSAAPPRSPAACCCCSAAWRSTSSPAR